MTPKRDPLEELLEAPPHLDAPEFTERVMNGLPRRRRLARPIILGAGGLFASAIAAALIAGESGAMGPSILSALTGRPGSASGALLASALLVLSGIAVAARELRETD